MSTRASSHSIIRASTSPNVMFAALLDAGGGAARARPAEQLPGATRTPDRRQGLFLSSYLSSPRTAYFSTLLLSRLSGDSFLSFYFISSFMLSHYFCADASNYLHLSPALVKLK